MTRVRPPVRSLASDRGCCLPSIVMVEGWLVLAK
jgi:hypothetical protein